MRDIKETTIEKIYECQKHIEKIKDAKEFLDDLMPLNLDTYLNIDKIQSSFIDQLVFRFSKLQDSLGEGLFRAVLILSKEDVKKKNFLDILNRLEELELVNKDEWLTLREIRNDISHEYSFNQEEVVDSINLIFKTSDRLEEIFYGLREYIEKLIEKK